jgi:hypothetical protein
MDPTTDSIPIKSAPSSNTIPIRISKPTSRLLKSILTKCNRKTHGRKVKVDDVLQKSLSLLADAHLEEIKNSTYSSQDQLEIEYKKFCQTNGNISKDEFLQRLLTAALPQVNQQPKETL